MKKIKQLTSLGEGWSHGNAFYRQCRIIYFFNLACWKRNKSCQLAVKITKENRCTVAYRRDQQRERAGKNTGKNTLAGKLPHLDL